jgi:hypothetical protein
MKTNKYNYFKVIQQNYGQGFEDVSEYQTNSQGKPKEYTQVKFASGTYRDTKETLLKHDLKEYRLMGYPTRVVQRKVLNTCIS